MKEKVFPRRLSKSEQEILLSILPGNKIGYKNYHTLIDERFLIGEGRFGNGNLILGFIDDKPDLTVPSSSVFALGNVQTSEGNYYVVIHSVDEEMIEFQVDPFPVEENIIIQNVTSYSDWNPGMESPEKKSKVYEFAIKEDEYLLAVCPLSKKIWLHEYKSQVNHIIPLSNFFNELMRLRNVKDEKSLQNPSNFFNEINSYSEIEIKTAFLLYNKYLKRFELNDILIESEKQKRSIKFFGRGLN